MIPSKRVASVDAGRCVACGACCRVCPREALSIWRGCAARVDGAACVGCGQCSRECPVD